MTTTDYHFAGECHNCHTGVYLTEGSEKPDVIECAPCSGKGKWAR